MVKGLVKSRRGRAFLEQKPHNLNEDCKDWGSERQSKERNLDAGAHIHGKIHPALGNPEQGIPSMKEGPGGIRVGKEFTPMVYRGKEKRS